MNPLMGYVMGIDESKTGRMPTDAEHATMRRLLNEAMDAGACGWSAQRLKSRTAPSSVQRDYDGSPMNTDVMHDETCIEMAKVLGERGEGFQELTLSSWDPKTDAQAFRDSSRRSAAARSCSKPSRRRIASRIAIANTMKWLERCRQTRTARLRPGRHHRCRPELHLRGLEPVRRLRRVA